MSRGYTAGMLTEITAGRNRPVVFVEVAINGGTSRWTSYHVDLTWDGQTWTGGGELLAVQFPEELVDVAARGVTVRVSGTAANLSTLLNSLERGRTLKIWLGMLDANEAIVADPQLYFSGPVDAGTWEDSQGGFQVVITAESELRDLDRPRGGRRTDTGQRAAHPGDLFLEYAKDMADWQGQWGKPHPGNLLREIPDGSASDPFAGEGDEWRPPPPPDDGGE